MGFRFRVQRCGWLAAAHIIFADGVLEHGAIHPGDHAKVEASPGTLVRIASIAIVKDAPSDSKEAPTASASRVLTLAVDLPPDTVPEALVGHVLVGPSSSPPP